jgi:hypothetical protein
MLKKIAIICACVWLSACDRTDMLSVSHTAVRPVIAQPPSPSPVQLLPVTWRVATGVNIQAVVDQLGVNQQNDNPVFLVTTMRDYENMSINLAELRRYIEQQQALITYYRNITTSN